MEVQQFIRRARGRWHSVHMHGGKDTATITAQMPIEVTIPLAGVRGHEWEELVRLVDDRVWETFIAMKPKED